MTAASVRVVRRRLDKLTRSPRWSPVMPRREGAVQTRSGRIGRWISGRLVLFVAIQHQQQTPLSLMMTRGIQTPGHNFGRMPYSTTLLLFILQRVTLRQFFPHVCAVTLMRFLAATKGEPLKRLGLS